jgi:gliding motility-associated lipoprotein GldD
MKVPLFISVLIAVSSCNSSYQAKPSGYFNIPLPAKRNYISFHEKDYPYSFQYPDDAIIVKDSNFFETTPNNNYWINVEYPAFNCKIYLSYNRVTGESNYKVKDAVTGKYRDSMGANSFDKLRTDAFNLTAKHIYKSTDIPNERIRNPKGIEGLLFKVGGNAASPIQFFLSDTSKHFLRGALYYDAQPNADSTRPITEFIMKDLQQLFNTLEWK